MVDVVTSLHFLKVNTVDAQTLLKFHSPPCSGGTLRPRQPGKCANSSVIQWVSGWGGGGAQMAKRPEKDVV